MKKYSTVFVDLDDTLIDTQKNTRLALAEIYNIYNLQKYNLTYESFQDDFLSINNNLWSLYEQGKITKNGLKIHRFYLVLKNCYVGLTEKKALEIGDAYIDFVSHQNNPIDGAIDLLNYLKEKDYRLSIISNGFDEVQIVKLKSVLMDHYFEHIITSDQVGRNKPHPDVFEFALTKCNSSRSESIMIGDNFKADIQGAKNSGIDQIWFNPNNLEKTIDIEPTFEIKNLSEVMEIL